MHMHHGCVVHVTIPYWKCLARSLKILQVFTGLCKKDLVSVVL